MRISFCQSTCIGSKYQIFHFFATLHMTGQIVVLLLLPMISDYSINSITTATQIFPVVQVLHRVTTMLATFLPRTVTQALTNPTLIIGLIHLIITLTIIILFSHLLMGTGLLLLCYVSLGHLHLIIVIHLCSSTSHAQYRSLSSCSYTAIDFIVISLISPCFLISNFSLSRPIPHYRNMLPVFQIHVFAPSFQPIIKIPTIHPSSFNFNFHHQMINHPQNLMITLIQINQAHEGLPTNLRSLRLL